MTTPFRVFVSSTCYDLLDVRAELDAWLRELGLDPLLSDSGASEFAVLPDRNSIETCLVNVRRCDAFILILNQRYGPSLKSVGFGDVSATHLEYLEAKAHSKPIFAFARDRLFADHSAWKKNTKATTFRPWWVLDTHPDGTPNLALLEFLGKHIKLVKGSPGSNWCDAFTNSVELKSLVGRRLERESRAARLALLERDGLLPQLIPLNAKLVATPGAQAGTLVEVHAQLYNSGPLALEVTFQRTGHRTVFLGATPPVGQTSFGYQCVLNTPEELLFEFTTVEGIRVRDTWTAVARTDGIVQHRDRRRDLL